MVVLIGFEFNLTINTLKTMTEEKQVKEPANNNEKKV